jgi:hypothetical protein
MYSNFLYKEKSESKVPYFIANLHGVLLLHFTPPNETVNSAYQATLKKLKRAVQCKRPQMSEKRMLLSHNNARSHAAHATVNLLE